MYIKTVIIFTFIYIGLTLQPINTSCHWREADLCIATVAVYANIYGLIPHTEEGLELFCRYVKESHECVKDFAGNCFTDDLTDSSYPFAESTVLFYDKFCTKGSPTQKEWLEQAPCMAQHFNKSKPCTEYALAGIENLAVIDNKDRYATVCCVFNHVIECITQVLNENCKTDTEKMLRTVIKMIMTDIPMATCRKFEAKSKRCLSLLPPEGSKSKGKDSENELVQLAAEFLSL